MLKKLKKLKINSLKNLNNLFPGFFLLFAAVFLFMCGCAHINPTDSEICLQNLQNLQKRVSREWRAKMDSDWGAVYALTTKRYKENITRDQFIRGGNLDVRGFSIKKIGFAADKKAAVVTICFDTIGQGMLFKGMQLRETWIWEEGEWRLKLPVNRNTPFDD